MDRKRGACLQRAAVQTATSIVRQMPLGWSCWCSAVPLSADISVRRLQKILTWIKYVCAGDVHLFMWLQERRNEVSALKCICCDWCSVLSLSCIRLSVPVDGEVISLYCSPVTKTVALQLTDRRILKYLWGKLGCVKAPGLRCSCYIFLKRFSEMIWLSGTWVTLAE